MKLAPYLDFSKEARFPIWGGLIQRRAGTARHDAVAWGFARGASRHGVDIIENCEVTGMDIEGDRIKAVGVGPDKPIASNTNAEGRANNRRVEIVVQPHTK